MQMRIQHYGSIICVLLDGAQRGQEISREDDILLGLCAAGLSGLAFKDDTPSANVA